MNTIITSKILMTMLIPMITALLVLITGKKENLRDGISVIGAILTFASVLSFLPVIQGGDQLQYTLFQIYPGVTVKLNLDPLGVIFAMVASFLWILAALYCVGYMRGLKEHAQTRFYICYAVSVGAAMGAAFSGYAPSG